MLAPRVLQALSRERGMLASFGASQPCLKKWSARGVQTHHRVDEGWGIEPRRCQKEAQHLCACFFGGVCLSSVAVLSVSTHCGITPKSQ